MYSMVKVSKLFATDVLRAHFVMVPKSQKDLHLWSNFHLISLQNVDLTILTKILASRLNTHLASLVHRDQIGYSNIILKTIHLQHLAHSSKQELFFLSFDIKIAFDILSWRNFWIGSQPSILRLQHWSATIALPLLGSWSPGVPGRICQSLNIEGLEIARIHNKLFLFADDILLFLSSLHVTLPCLKEVLQWFGTLPGFKVNKSKSRAMNDVFT